MNVQTKAWLRILVCTFLGLLAGLFVGFVFSFFWPIVPKLGVVLLVTLVGFFIGVGLYR